MVLLQKPASYVDYLLSGAKSGLKTGIRLNTAQRNVRKIHEQVNLRRI